MSDRRKRIDRIAGKAGYALGEYDVDFPGFAVSNHALELCAGLQLGAGDAFIRIHPDKLPLRIRLDEFLIMLDLCLIAGCLFLIVS